MFKPKILLSLLLLLLTSDVEAMDNGSLSPEQQALLGINAPPRRRARDLAKIKLDIVTAEKNLNAFFGEVDGHQLKLNVAQETLQRLRDQLQQPSLSEETRLIIQQSIIQEETNIENLKVQLANAKERLKVAMINTNRLLDEENAIILNKIRTGQFVSDEDRKRLIVAIQQGEISAGFTNRPQPTLTERPAATIAAAARKNKPQSANDLGSNSSSPSSRPSTLRLPRPASASSSVAGDLFRGLPFTGESAVSLPPSSPRRPGSSRPASAGQQSARPRSPRGKA